MGNFYINKFPTFLWAVEDQNEAKYCKVSTRQVAQGKEFGNVIINYDEIGRQN